MELIKTAATWKLSLENLGRILEVLGECDQGGGEGLNYEEYLRVLLAAGSREKYPMRALDMIEANLRRKEETSAFRAAVGNAGFDGVGKLRVLIHVSRSAQCGAGVGYYDING